MGFNKIVAFSAFVFGLLMAAAPAGRADEGLFLTISVSVKTTPDPIRPGPVSLKLKVKPLLPTMKCKEIGLSLKTVDNLVYNGPLYLTADSDDSGIAVFSLEAVFPANDTAGFVIQIECDGKRHQTNRLYWVLSGDSTKFYRGDPRTSPEAKYPPTKRRTITREERQIEKMRRLEELPLTEYETQTIQVGDKVYQRRRGEFKFHEIQPVGDPVEYMRQWSDSIRAIQSNVPVECTADLRDSNDLKYVRSLADSLKPTEQPGFYRVFMKGHDYIEIRNRDILLEIISVHGGRPGPP